MRKLTKSRPASILRRLAFRLLHSRHRPAWLMPFWRHFRSGIAVKRQRRLRAEFLEERALLAAISGTVYYDVNSDLTHDLDDRPLAEWRVYLDSNQNGNYDSGEVSVLTDAHGFYRFGDLDSGTYRVARQSKTGWSALSPSQGSASLELTDDAQVTLDFGNTLTGLIHHWPFDEISGSIAEDRIGDNDANLVNWGANEAPWQPGFIQGAINFEQSDDYAITTQAIASLNQFSVSFWSKVNSRIADNQVLLTPQGANWIADTDDGIGLGSVHDPSNPMTQIWEQYVITVDRTIGIVTVYRDGTPVADGGTTISALTQPWVFGHNQDPANHGSSWHGLLDDVRIFNRVLERADVNVLAYRPPQPGLQSVLVAAARDFGVVPAGRFHTERMTLDFDPQTTDWLAWNRFPDLRAMAAGQGQKLFLGSHRPEIDDSVVLTIRNPQGISLTVELDQNGALGAPSGPQAVIYGEASKAPDALRGDNFENPNLFNESGTHNSIFTVAGEYEFTFEFSSILTSNGGFPDVWLVMQRQPCIAGTVWHDLNADGAREGAEPSLSGWQVYLDVNDNGQRDPDESAVFTDSGGNYHLYGATRGTNVVRQIVPQGWSAIAPDAGVHRIRGVPLLGCLEDVNFGSKRDPAPFSSKNFVISKGNRTAADWLIEYTMSGIALQSVAMSGVTSVLTDVAQDLVFDSQLQLHVINGLGSPRITTYDSNTNSFEDTTVLDWETQGDLRQIGHVAAFEDLLFASESGNETISPGVIRFRESDLSWTRFPMESLDELTIGLDGFLYVMTRGETTTSVRSYFPKSMRLSRSIVLPERLNAISVDANGRLFGVSDNRLLRFSSSGSLQGSVAISGQSIDISADGQKLLITSSDRATLIAPDFSGQFDIILPDPNSSFGFGTFVQTPIHYNFPPEAVHQAYSLDEDGILQTPAPGLLNGSYDENLDVVTARILGPPAHGKATVNLNGSFSYQPDPDFTGEDRFTFRLRDGQIDSNVATATVTVRSVSDNPRLTPANPTDTTNEDTDVLLPLSDFVNGGTGTTTIVDPDPGALVGGIAVTSITGNGRWSYSLDGTAYHPFELVSRTSARLLPPNARLKYSPDGKNGETAKLEFLAWDPTTGSAGTVADVTSGAGTAFSIANDTVTIQVSAVNDAPVLEPIGPQLTSFDEDTPFAVTPTAFITTISDTDVASAVGGIAITSFTGRGRWYYALESGNFVELSRPSESFALLLRATDSIRYEPDAVDGETITVTYRAWDTTVGTAGAHLNIPGAGTGGTSAFSSATDSATFIVRAVNDPPTAITTSSFMVNENRPGAVVGTLSVTDVDPGDTHTFTVDDERFEVVEHQLKLKPDVSLNHELTPSFNIGITTRDSAGSEFTRLMFILVVNENEPPTDVNLSSSAIRENVTGADVGQLAVSDEDFDDSHTFIVDDPRFEFRGNQLKLRDDQSLNYELARSLQINLTVRDAAGAEFTKRTTLSVTDVNDRPTDLSLSANSISENQRGGTIGSVHVADEDVGDTFTLAVDDSRFQLVDNLLQLRSDVSLNFELTPTISLPITVTDAGGLQLIKPLTILVVNENERPSDLRLSANLLDENTIGADIGDISVDDPDVGDVQTLTVNDERFEIVNQRLRLKANQSLDFESEDRLIVTLAASDSAGLTFTKTVSLLVQDVNERPTELSLSSATVSENDTGALVGQLTVADVDAREVFTFQLDDNRFEVIEGQLKLKTGTSMDHESASSVVLAVTVMDSGGLELKKSFTILVNDINERPTEITLSAVTVTENQPGAQVGVLTVFDPDLNDQHTISLDDDRFTLDGNRLSLQSDSWLNFESESQIPVTITARDRLGLEVQRQITIHVIDANDQPTSIQISNRTFLENISGAVIGDLSATDEDADQQLSFFVSDPRFEIQGMTLKLRSGQFLTLDASADLTVVVSATDNGAEPKTAATTISLSVLPNPHVWRNPFNALDADNDPQHIVAPIDALLIINLLNDSGGLLDSSGRLPQSRAANSTEPFFDTDGNGFTTPIDALLVINFLNEGTNGEQPVPGNDLLGTTAVGISQLRPSRPPGRGTTDVSHASGYDSDEAFSPITCIYPCPPNSVGSIRGSEIRPARKEINDLEFNYFVVGNRAHAIDGW